MAHPTHPEGGFPRWPLRKPLSGLGFPRFPKGILGGKELISHADGLGRAVLRKWDVDVRPWKWAGRSQADELRRKSRRRVSKEEWFDDFIK